MKEIHYKHPHRQAHFAFFNAMAQPHFSICANVDITKFKKWLAASNLEFTPSIVYAIALAANSVPEFRHRIREQTIVEHEAVHPSFAVYTEVADVFSFCEVKYQERFPLFYSNALLKIAAMRHNPVFEDEPGRDDYLFLSSIPWVAFTGLTHAMHAPVQDSVPRITWGKYFTANNRIQMPLSVQAHHAVVDGRHVGLFYELLQDILDNPSQLIAVL